MSSVQSMDLTVSHDLFMFDTLSQFREKLENQVSNLKPAITRGDGNGQADRPRHDDLLSVWRLGEKIVEQRQHV